MQNYYHWVRYFSYRRIPTSSAKFENVQDGTTVAPSTDGLSTWNLVTSSESVQTWVCHARNEQNRLKTDWAMLFSIQRPPEGPWCKKVLSVVLTRDIFLHVRTMQKNTTYPRQHSPTMTVSAGPSEIRSPHKNHRRYKTSDATQSKGTPKTTTSPARSHWYVVFFKNERHQHHANFVTFFDMARRDGNSTFCSW